MMTWTPEEFRRAQQRVGTGEKALRWAFRFIETDVSTLLTAERSALYLELMAFIYAPPKAPPVGDGDTLALPDVLLTTVQSSLYVLLYDVVLERPIRSRPAPRYLVTLGDRYGYRVEGADPIDELYATVEQMLLSLPAGHRIRACPAPRPRQMGPCARLLVTTRAGQQYCSLECQQRAGHRRAHEARTARSA